MLDIIKRILRLAGSRGKKIKLGFLLGFIDGFFEGATIAALIYAFVAIGRGLSPGDIGTVIAIQLAGLCGHIICRYCVARFQGGAGVEIMAEQRLKIGEILKRVPMGFFSSSNMGEIAATATTDLGFIENYCMFILDRVVNGFVATAVVAVFLVVYDWRIGLIVLVSIIPIVAIFRYLQKKGKLLTPKRQDAQAGLVSATLEYVQGIEVIKSFNMNGDRARNITRAIKGSEENSYKLEKGFVPMLSVYSLFIKICCALIIFVISTLALNGSASISELFIIVISTFGIFTPIEQAVSLTALMRMMEASLNRLEKITEADFIDADAADIEPSCYDIEFKDVSFAYDSALVIEKLSFKAPQGSTTAIVGESGSGKTTVTNLIARFWDASDGNICIGGIDLRQMSCDAILKNISIVFQKVYLFNDTVLGNLRFGKPDAELDEVVAACKKARCHDFIMALEDGYETMIGEGGSTLSGGEKQRLSIARAILKDAPIVLLDEATSSIDPENEKYIQEAINNLVRGRTLIVIAHRLTSIRGVDNILVLDRGRLAQAGLHDELIKQDGIYKDFWNIRQKADNWKIVGA
ncbi:MAG: ABC transporter ATP-binding protein [Spirochaetales bacterium]|nr:ABC transporter ATP-binding protein [Spirochaetales bacterium]